MINSNINIDGLKLSLAPDSQGDAILEITYQTKEDLEEEEEAEIVHGFEDIEDMITILKDYLANRWKAT